MHMLCRLMVIKLLPIYNSMAPLHLDTDQQSNRIEVQGDFLFWDLIAFKIFVNDRFYQYLWIF